MSQQIRFFNKNFFDYAEDNTTITATDDVATNEGQAFVNLMRDRRNTTGWKTSGSSDAANCSLLFEFGDPKQCDTLVITNTNLKSYVLETFNGTTWSTLSTVTDNEKDTIFLQFTELYIYKLRITINSTIVTDADKYISQVILTSKIGPGQFETWPQIKRPEHDTNKKVSQMLSGKMSVNEGVGGFNCRLEIRYLKSEADLDLIEQLYYHKAGFLVYLSGGDESQFSSRRKGYRNIDLYLMRFTDNYRPEWVKSIYVNGMKLKMMLKEVVK